MPNEHATPQRQTSTSIQLTLLNEVRDDVKKLLVHVASLEERTVGLEELRNKVERNEGRSSIMPTLLSVCAGLFSGLLTGFFHFSGTVNK